MHRSASSPDLRILNLLTNFQLFITSTYPFCCFCQRWMTKSMGDENASLYTGSAVGSSEFKQEELLNILGGL